MTESVDSGEDRASRPVIPAPPLRPEDEARWAELTRSDTPLSQSPQLAASMKADRLARIQQQDAVLAEHGEVLERDAMFDGTCPACGKPQPVGARIANALGFWAHLGCSACRACGAYLNRDRACPDCAKAVAG